MKQQSVTLLSIKKSLQDQVDKFVAAGGVIQKIQPSQYKRDKRK